MEQTSTSCWSPAPAACSRSRASSGRLASHLPRAPARSAKRIGSGRAGSAAKAAADALRVPLLVANFERQYWTDVFAPWLEAYAGGATPNPDVACNRFVKFGAFRAYALSTLSSLTLYGVYLLIASRAAHGVITLGIPLGLGVILSAIVLTGVYVRRANGEFDRDMARIVARCSAEG